MCLAVPAAAACGCPYTSLYGVPEKTQFLKIISDWAVQRSPCNDMQMCLSDGENVFLVHCHLHSRPGKLSLL